MNREELCSLLKEYPVIAAVKDEKGLEECIFANCRVVFILYGNVMNICRIVKRVKDAHKTVFVHIDLIEGLSAKEVAVKFYICHPYLLSLINEWCTLLHKIHKTKSSCTFF